MTGTFTVYDLVLILLFAGGVVERLVAWHSHRVHTREIEALEEMHEGTVENHPPEPSPGENPLPYRGLSSSELLSYKGEPRP
jgi:hypothetical protein